VHVTSEPAADVDTCDDCISSAKNTSNLAARPKVRRTVEQLTVTRGRHMARAFRANERKRTVASIIFTVKSEIGCVKSLPQSLIGLATGERATLPGSRVTAGSCHGLLCCNVHCLGSGIHFTALDALVSHPHGRCRVQACAHQDGCTVIKHLATAVT
jgi:hypothetical protein